MLAGWGALSGSPGQLTMTSTSLLANGRLELRPSLNLIVEYRTGDERWIEEVLGRTDAARRTLNSLMPDALLARIRVVVAPTKKEFLSLVGGWAEHSVAVAMPTRPVPMVVIDAETLRTVPLAELSQTLVHELAHCYLALRLPRRPPRWFDEGVAMLAADEWKLEDAVAVTMAALANRTIPLRELQYHFPSDPARQRLAYQQSASLVRLLVEENGGSLAKLLQGMIGPEGERAATQLWDPFWTQLLEMRWRQELRSWRNWALLVLNSGLFWGTMAILTIVAWILKRQRNLARRREWEKEESVYAALDEEKNRDSDWEATGDANEPRPPWYG